MIMEPGLSNRDALNLLRRAAIFARNHPWPYPLANASDIRGAPHAIAGGYLRRRADDRHMVEVTEKGTAYLERLMRCE